jgi:hypothetical protein
MVHPPLVITRWKVQLLVQNSLAACVTNNIYILTFSPRPEKESVVEVLIFLIFVEAWGGCEADGETTGCVEIHMDGEEHWHCARPEDTWTWHHPTESLLLLAAERCLGGAQGFT